MTGSRLFSLKPEIKISASEAIVIQRAYEKMKGRRKEIGHIVQEIAQEAVETVIARYTMLDDRSE
jgi:hypothetical protein